MKLFELLGIITVNNSDANDKIGETTTQTENLHNKLKSGIGFCIGSFFNNQRQIFCTIREDITSDAIDTAGNSNAAQRIAICKSTI